MRNTDQKLSNQFCFDKSSGLASTLKEVAWRLQTDGSVVASTVLDKQFCANLTAKMTVNVSSRSNIVEKKFEDLTTAELIQAFMRFTSSWVKAETELARMVKSWNVFDMGEWL